MGDFTAGFYRFFLRNNHSISSGNSYICDCRNAVPSAGKRYIAAEDRNKPFSRLGRSCLQPVISAGDNQLSVLDLNRFRTFDSVVRREDFKGAVFQVKIILAGDAIVDIAVYREFSRPSDIKIIF